MGGPKRKRRRVHSNSQVTKSLTPVLPTTKSSTSTATTTIPASTRLPTATPICFPSPSSPSNRLSAKIEQESNAVTKPCQTVVLYTEEQAAYIQRHQDLLWTDGIETDVVICADKQHFIGIDFTKYSRIDLLVDKTMCNLLMVDDELHISVHKKFKEIDSPDRTIYVSNKMSADDELFNQLYYRLPRKARNIFKDCRSQDLFQATTSTEIAGGTTTPNTRLTRTTKPNTRLTRTTATSNTGLTGETTTTDAGMIGGTATNNTRLPRRKATSSSGLSGGSVTTSTRFTRRTATNSVRLTGGTVTTNTDLTGETATNTTMLTRRTATNSAGLTGGAVTTSTGMTGGTVTTSNRLTRRTATNSARLTGGKAATSTGMSGGTVTTSTRLTRRTATASAGLAGETVTTTTGMTGELAATSTSLTERTATSGTGLIGETVTTSIGMTYGTTTVPSTGTATTSTGMTSGSATRSNVAGSVGGNVHYGNVNNTYYQSDTYKRRKKDTEFVCQKRKITMEYDAETYAETDPNKVHIDIDFRPGKENTFYLQLTDNEVKLTTKGVKSAKITRGSVIITLTMEEDFIITEDWIQDVLRIIFDDILGAYIEEGETSTVTVGRYVTNQAQTLHEKCVSEENYMKQVQRVRELEKQIEELELERKTLLQQEMLDASLHENCEAKEEYMKQVEKVQKLEKQVEELELEKKNMLQQELLDSADVSTKVSGTEEGKISQQEDQLPTKTSLQEVHDQYATLIYYNTDKMLQESCRAGQLEVVKSLLTKGRVDINSRGEGGVTPVLIAAWHGNKQVFDLLVKKKCDLSLSLDNGNNILHVACFGGDVEIVDYIISNRIVDIESRGMYGRTAIMKAAHKGKKNVFDQLVKKGCDLSVVDDNGANILHLAVSGGNVSIVEQILTDQIIDMNSRDEKNNTPLRWARFYKQENVARFLVERGANE